ncbi:MAG TPA: helix-turn-helix domain-containing protein [Solirubrobacteraceae bacterium]|jgi:AcrR family transcriptional regulator|nr:helix-turn-helix domain-containing protein [Solirubrobacteraceae bacterium]
MPRPLYQRLPPGPHGVPREDVARNQRTRLYGAMIEAIWQFGYRNTSVADVLALAGVSRRTFYEHFANKEACFLATFNIILARERKRMIEAWDGEHGWSNRLYAACSALLGGAAADPRGLHLVLVEASTAGSNTRTCAQQTAATFARMLASAHRLTPDRRLPPLAPTAIVGGIRHIIVRRLLERREQELLRLTDGGSRGHRGDAHKRAGAAEVLDWIECYQLRATAPVPAHTPSEPTETPRIARLTGRDGGARRVDGVAAEALEVARRRMDAAASWPEAVPRALAGVAAHLAKNAAIIEQAASTPRKDPRAIEETVGRLEQLARVLTNGAPAPRCAPGVAHEAIAGALGTVISDHARHGRLAQLPGAVNHIAVIVLAPYLGARGVRETMRASE